MGWLAGTLVQWRQATARVWACPMCFPRPHPCRPPAAAGAGKGVALHPVYAQRVTACQLLRPHLPSTLQVFVSLVPPAVDAAQHGCQVGGGACTFSGRLAAGQYVHGAQGDLGRQAQRHAACAPFGCGPEALPGAGTCPPCAPALRDAGPASYPSSSLPPPPPPSAASRCCPCCWYGWPPPWRYCPSSAGGRGAGAR